MWEERGGASAQCDVGPELPRTGSGRVLGVRQEEFPGQNRLFESLLTVTLRLQRERRGQVMGKESNLCFRENSGSSKVGRLVRTGVSRGQKG